MDDKVFNLLEKMYSELTNKIEKIDTKIEKLDTKIESIGNQVTVIEAKHGKKLDIIFEEIVSIKQKLVDHDLRFDSIESKIETQDFEIKVLKRAK